MNRSRSKLLSCFLATVTISAGLAGQPPQLMEAARQGNAREFKRALKAPDAHVNAVDEHGFTPLMYAARYLSKAEMQLLLGRGADPNFHNVDDVSAFNFCVADPDKARLLLDHGFDQKKNRPGAATPLFVAARHPHGFEVTKLLLERGADVNARGPLDGTPLFFAIYSGNAQTVELLLKHGANINTVRKFDDSTIGLPITEATLAVNSAVVKTLLDYHPDLNASDGFAGHSLSAALVTGQDEIARTLIERGADVRAAKNIGEVPPIVMAAHNEHGDPEMLKLLLAKGADINAKTDRDETAFTWAQKRGETELTRFLEAKGANPGTAAPKVILPDNPVSLTPENRDSLVRAAATRSISILQVGSNGFLDRETRPEKCISCHHQTLPGVAFGWASRLGLAIDQKQLARQTADQRRFWNERKSRAWFLDDPLGGVMENLGYGLLNFSQNKQAADEITDAMTYYLTTQELPTGGWMSFTARPPAESTPITSTALVIHALDLYPPVESAQAAAARKNRVKKFLLSRKAFTTEERTYQLLGLAWVNASRAAKPLASELIRQQHADGGWSQIPTLASDAYATGQVLVALLTSGAITIDSPVYLRGAQYLLRTQFADGSWYVKSRTWPFQTHFATGFPHGRDQWISAPATAWATLALLWSLDPAGPEAFRTGRRPTSS